ncbi:MAG TPA: winged helix-turn-helix transcriptional regulator [Methanotrichaceae archaeon]|nr:winged helix-turn-helix transcriptional regulator [Methanotrichaceae archaeon]HQF16958.1 winged helix-turn-helix transcriptional regulator [Methanotrichaceae archaeon]HQI91578.1 winged helix-turn-helix transcriptional regulator [Methanotrichaceae archaeon]HQJ28927.1 winged helix-turn-helix transcriptional regulator [Methanotrichaceae archaeon]
MVLSLKNLLENADGEVIVNLSGGPREIFLAFTIACLSQSEKISRVTNFSDIDRRLNEIIVPNIVSILEEKQKRILKDVFEKQPTTITDIAERLFVSESTISRHVARLVDLKMLDIAQKGKIKEIRITLAGKLLL